jgi:hypothetical protein
LQQLYVCCTCTHPFTRCPRVSVHLTEMHIHEFRPLEVCA